MKNEKTIAVIPGSFDPITLGHLDLIERAAALFDTVYVTIFRNSEKTGMFTDDEKIRMMKLATQHLPSVICSAEDGLTAVFAAEKNAVLIKGVRSVSDFDYEMNLSDITRAITPSVDTLFFPAKQEYLHISSSYVREMIRYGHDFRNAVPESVYQYLTEEWKKS